MQAQLDRGLKRSKFGFTLIELLVVIAIIAILASILFPVFARAREQARKAACQSNLKQLGLAMMQYVQDFDETYPVAQFDASPTRYWYQVIEPYVKSTQVFVCPTAGQIRRVDGTDTVQHSGGYGYNIGGTQLAPTPAPNVRRNGFGYRTSGGNWWTPTGTGPLKISTIQEAADTIQMADPSSNSYQNNGFFAVAYANSSYMPVLHGGRVGPFTSSPQALTVPPLEGGGNYLFADGHVKFIQATRAWGSALWNVDKSNTSGVLHP